VEFPKLKTGDSSFSRLVDEERQRVLSLHPHVPVTVLCDLLGFQDVSAYYKARKRWGTPEKRSRGISTQPWNGEDTE